MRLIVNSIITLLLCSSLVAWVNLPSKESILRPVNEVTYGRLNIFLTDEIKEPTALICLVPGVNRDGLKLVNEEWLNFARQNHMHLCAVTFKSDIDVLMDDRGYYVTSRGSGGMFISEILDKYDRVPPMYFFGWSGGAHYVSSFVENFPEHIRGWCAYSAEWWEPIIETGITPPGIVACGEDDYRMEPTHEYFKSGRKRGRPWTWMMIKNTPHRLFEPLEAWVRDYFQIIINYGGVAPEGIYYWNNETAADANEAHRSADASWFPDKSLIDTWRKLHDF